MRRAGSDESLRVELLAETGEYHRARFTTVQADRLGEKAGDDGKV